MRLEIKINIVCAFMIFISFFVIPYFVVYNNRIGGNILNEGSEIVNDEYYDNFSAPTPMQSETSSARTVSGLSPVYEYWEQDDETGYTVTAIFAQENR